MGIINQIKECFKNNHKNDNKTIVSFKSRQTVNFQECVICLEYMKNQEILTMIHCSHMYHTKCLERWILINNTCPLCDIKVNKI
jgi:hypothetical protein